MFLTSSDRSSCRAITSAATRRRLLLPIEREAALYTNMAPRGRFEPGDPTANSRLRAAFPDGTLRRQGLPARSEAINDHALRLEHRVEFLNPRLQTLAFLNILQLIENQWYRF